MATGSGPSSRNGYYLAKQLGNAPRNAIALWITQQPPKNQSNGNGTSAKASEHHEKTPTVRAGELTGTAKAENADAFSDAKIFIVRATE